MQDNFHVDHCELLPVATIIHHVTPDGELWATNGRRILRRDTNHAWHPISVFPFRSPRDFFGWSRLPARASRADKANLFVTSHNNIIGVRANQVYSVLDSTLSPLFLIKGDCVLHNGICEDVKGCIYLGEYFRNTTRDPVTIWRISADLQSHEKAYVFQAGRIRHVHGIFRDPFEPETMWITTGDSDGECFLGRTTDRFNSLEMCGDGTQICRAVKLYFTPEHVCWLTDSNLTQNHACRMNRRTGDIEIGMKLPCPGWYGTTTTDGVHVAGTTVEAGPGVTSDKCSLLASRNAFDWEEVKTFKKDRWRPLRLFKYGVISFPSGQMTSNNIYLSGEGLVGLDGTSLRATVGSKWSQN